MGFRKIRKGVAVVLSAALMMSSFPNVGNKTSFGLTKAKAEASYVDIWSEDSYTVSVPYNTDAVLEVEADSDDLDDVTIRWYRITGYDEYGYPAEFEDTNLSCPAGGRCHLGERAG